MIYLKPLFKLTLLSCSVLLCSCAKSHEENKLPKTESYNYFQENPNNPKSSVNTDDENIPIDELFKVYQYFYVDGKVIKTETNVLFVNGKSDELQVIIDIPNSEPMEFHLFKSISLGVIKGIDTYVYKTEKDELINVFFYEEKDMMGIEAGGNSFVFMNNPDYN